MSIETETRALQIIDLILGKFEMDTKDTFADFHQAVTKENQKPITVLNIMRSLYNDDSYNVYDFTCEFIKIIYGNIKDDERISLFGATLYDYLGNIMSVIFDIMSDTLNF